jgi:uncharacterized protein HemY
VTDVDVGVGAGIGIMLKRNNIYIITATKAITANISAILPESIIIVIIINLKNKIFFSLCYLLPTLEGQGGGQKFKNFYTVSLFVNLLE